jgi:hypothetical protein
MRGWLLCLLATASGCASVFGIGDPEVGGAGSCPIGSFDLCATQNPNGPIAFTTDVQIVTDRDCSVVLYEPQAGSICVIYATEIDVAGSATVTGTGSRPLVLAATGAITIAGTLDVSSYYQTRTGAGSDPSTCAVEREPGVDAMGAGGGGAGGSFGGTGGNGGTGATGTATGGAPGAAVSVPAYPRGGCRGGDAMSQISGGPGSGGGVLWIVAGEQIALAATGRILAAGAGGGPGVNFGGGEGGGSGGSGGGSGGFLRIAAPTVTISGVVIANGGGGGEGGDTAAVGKAGTDGVAATQPSKGGSGGSAPGGDGGTGAAGTMLDGTPGSPSTAAAGAGGGGGGGGAGAIVLSAETLTTTGATISPPAI